MANFDLDLEDINPVFDLVVFRHVHDIKLTQPVVHVTYDLGHDFDPSTRDWIGLFYTGWNSVGEYLVYKWAPIFPQNLNTIHRRRRVVIFPSSELKDLKDETAYFQLLYIARGDHVIGVSNPFKFCIQPGYEDDLHFDTLEKWAMSSAFTFIGDEPKRKRSIEESFDIINDFDTFEPLKKKWQKKKPVSMDPETLVNLSGIQWGNIFLFAKACSDKKEDESKTRVVVPYKPIYNINDAQKVIVTVQENPLACVKTGLLSLSYEHRLALMPGPQSFMIQIEETSKHCGTCALGKVLFKQYATSRVQDQNHLSVLQKENKKLRDELKGCKMLLKQQNHAERFRVVKENLQKLNRIITQNQELETKLEDMEICVNGLIEEKQKKEAKNKTDEDKHDDEIIRLLKEGFRGVLDVNGQQIEIADIGSSSYTGENSWKVKFPKRIERMRSVIDQQNNFISSLKETVASQNKLSAQKSQQMIELRKDLNRSQKKLKESARKVSEMTSRIRGILRDRAKELTNEWRQFARDSGAFRYENKSDTKYCHSGKMMVRSAIPTSLQIRRPACLRFPGKSNRICPTCNMSFAPHVDSRVIEEHIFFHSHYDKKYN